MLGAKCNELGRDDARSEPVSEPLSEPTAPGLGEPCRSPSTIATKSSMAFLSLFPGEAVPLAYQFSTVMEKLGLPSEAHLLDIELFLRW